MGRDHPGQRLLGSRPLKQRTRLWLALALALLALLVVGMVLQAFNQLIWQLSSVLPYGMVGPVALLLVLAAALLLGQLAWPWLRDLSRGGWRFGSQGGREAPRPQEPPPSSRREAAARQLAGIDQTLERVRDSVAREALRQQQQRMAAELERGDLVVVVFGVGSSGKTSLIRALLRELVGEVGAAMGSTAESERYRLRLKGLERGIWLVDTPGILEGGSDGESRGRMARQQAATADLLVVVVDGDLRATETELVQALAGLGKRMLLVLNKCDLRGEAEEARLLQLLRQRTAGLLEAADVVPTSAAPQSIPQPGGRPLQPEPEVEALLRRMASVLHADGEELIADNLLLQSRQLGEASRQLLATQRRSDAETIVERYMWIGAGVLAATPLPGLDLLGAAAVNAQMVVEIARLYGISLSRDSAQELAVSVGRTLATLGLVKGGVGLLSAALSVNLPALVVSRALQAVSAAWLTRVAGSSFITYFERDQDWGDGGIQEVVQQHYSLSRRDGALRQFLEAAFSRVVEPLRARERQLPPRPQKER
jgi:small GTP-binding protein